MATRLAKLTAMTNTPHTNGIYSDMSVDGPEIGTLVVVVDRAKNLPNRKTMGKQDPYCAARLGKEAKKTETDKRGGQTPKWDQELRFTVRESPDYYTMKVSVFNDDKKTELIGETFIRLFDVIVPKGGQSDTWHSLQCKGKYAGEIRLELTYYDTRPPTEAAPVAEPKQEYAPVKRRPLPKNPAAPPESPIMAGEIPPPTKGPRSHHSLRHSPPKENGSALPFSPADFDVYHQYPVQPVAQPPQNAHHARPQSIVLQNSRPMHDLRARPQSYIELPHAHSAPNVPTQEHMPDVFYDRETQYPPDPRDPYPPRQELALRDPGQQPGQNGNYSYGAAWRMPRSAMQPTVEDEVEVAPPPPPAHRRTPPNALVQQAPRYPVDMAPAPLNVSQGRRYSHVAPGQSPQSGNTPEFPPPLTPATGSPEHRTPLHHRYSMGAYSPNSYHTPPRQPQQLEYHTPPSHGGPGRPSPLVHSESAPAAPEQHYYQQLVPRDPNSFHGQRPVSPGASPIDGRQPRMMGCNPPNRKSVSPRPPPNEGPANSMVPYGPDSFNTYNPRTSPAPSSRPGDGQQSRDMDLHARDENGNIITQDGRKVDPSDHLPVDSWAPEPEPKGKDRNKHATPTRPRDRLNGARELHSGGGPGRGNDRAIRDAVDTQFGRSPGGHNGHSPALDASPTPGAHGHSSNNMIVTAPRRLQKRSTAPMPLRERENINTHVPPASYHHSPHAQQQQHYSPHSPSSHYSPQHHPSPHQFPPHHHHPQQNQNHYYSGGHAAPPIPAKIPINHQDGMGADDLAALSHELKGIDIGSAPSSTRRRWLRRG
ncbi:hypothetical protein HDK77DRAFT_443666 [Phyllosticta capitalensis]